MGALKFHKTVNQDTYQHYALSGLVQVLLKRRSRALQQIQHLNVINLPGLIVQMCTEQLFIKYLLFLIHPVVIL